MQKDFLKATDIMEILSVSTCTAYKIIRELNQELIEKGFRVKNGRVNTSYFRERYKLSPAGGGTNG